MMKNSENKTTVTTIALLLALMIVASLTLPIVSAHTPAWTVPTYPYLNVTPNPVGVDQTVQVTFWIDKVPPTASTIFGDRWIFYVNITKPDGTTQIFGPYKSDDVGGSYMQYTPDSVGTYYFQAIFPEQVLAGANPPPTGNTSPYINDTYQASTSKRVELTVQEEPIQPWPVTPLPTDYWTRPINMMNPEWRSIAGDWLMGGRGAPDSTAYSYNPFSTAPETGHVVWTYPVAPGGVVGGNYTDPNYYTGLTYESKFNSPVIMYGRLFFNLPLSTSAGAGGAVCIDLRTGQQLWWQNNTTISFGQEFDYQSPNQFGAIPYLWQTGATYNCYDPWTGQWLFGLANASTGQTAYGPNGELLVYILNSANNWLALWNSTQAIMYYQQPGVLPGGNVWQWRPMMQRTMNWMKGVQWNATIEGYPGRTQSITALTSDVILATASMSYSPQDWQMEIGYSPKDGHQLWVQNRTTPIGATTWALMGPAADGVYTEFYQSTTQWYGFSLTTGEKLWGPTEPYPNAFGMYSWRASIAYGKLITEDYGGYVHAYNLQTGKKEWDWFAGSSGLETAYGAWPINHPAPVSADGKIYVSAGHGYNPPLFKGAKMYCLNATDGTLIWSLLGFHTYNPILIADGFLVAYNSYDAQVYCYGKGQTATTVAASPEISVHGSSVLIKGTVTDQSPGAKDTPAIADESMSPWMEYLYMQQPRPQNATGVEVSLDTLDPNGNFVHIGTATSDTTGLYSYMFTPEVPGKYTIIATFAGSKSYYGSFAETAIGVDEASLPTEEPHYPQPIDNTWTIVGVGIAIIIVVVIIGIWIKKK